MKLFELTKTISVTLFTILSLGLLGLVLTVVEPKYPVFSYFVHDGTACGVVGTKDCVVSQGYGAFYQDYTESTTTLFEDRPDTKYFFDFDTPYKKREILMTKEQYEVAKKITETVLKKTDNETNYFTAVVIAFLESSFRPNVIGKNHEKGLFQFKQATWDWLSKKSGIVGSPFEVETSTRMFIWAWDHGYRNWWMTSKFIK